MNQVWQRWAGDSLDGLARRLTLDRARVLMYHRFGRAGSYRRLNVQVFEAHLRYIRDHFQPVPLSRIVESLRSGQSLPEKSVAITVDDGYRDFFVYAYPLLLKYRIPATIFVVTRFVDQSLWLWFDAIHFLVHAARPGSYFDVVDSANGKDEFVKLSSDDDRNFYWERVADYCVGLPPRERQETLRCLATSLGEELPDRPTEEYSAMSWEEIRALDSNLVDVGAHTRSHLILSQCDDTLQHHEILGSRLDIESKLGRPVRHFCYPNGLPKDYNGSTLRLVQEAGFVCALVAHGALVRKGANPYLIERIGAPKDMREFKNVLNGLCDLKGQLRTQWKLK